MTNGMTNEMVINGETWIRKSTIPTGSRAVVVVDRGWIFAGDVTESNGRIRLSRCVQVLRWTGGQGFAGMVANPTKDVDLRPCADADMPADAEIFRIPVSDDWGL
jgi:hypothetical protein